MCIKNLRRHGLIQSFSRTNRILGSKKVAGNIVCYRNLDDEIEEAIVRFGDAEAYNVVVLQSYSYYRDFFVDAVDKLREIAARGQIRCGCGLYPGAGYAAKACARQLEGGRP